MQLITDTIIAKFKELGEQDEVTLSDKKVVVKYFDAHGSWRWYALSASVVIPEEPYYVPIATATDEQISKRTDVLFFGYVEGVENEFGDFSLSELIAVGPRIERDLHIGCGEKPLKEIVHHPI